MIGINPLTIIYAGTKRVGAWWNFKNVISPFFRLYYINGGEGEVLMHGRTYKLTPGKLFLIPKFTFHAYRCADFMEHTYVCFFDDMYSGDVIYERDELECLVDAEIYDNQLVNRLLELNPMKSLPYVDPLIYDNGHQQYAPGRCLCSRSQAESTGILMQLMSRFMAGNDNRMTRTVSERMECVSRYISCHMKERITMDDLSQLVCISTDHFSRLFKKITGESPFKYLQRRRIERAQHLLLTSDLSIGRIAYEVGIPNMSQFSRLFSRMCNCSPSHYRCRQPEMFGCVISGQDGCAAY